MQAMFEIRSAMLGLVDITFHIVQAVSTSLAVAELR